MENAVSIGTVNAGYTIFAILPVRREPSRVVVAAQRDSGECVTWEAAKDGTSYYWGHYFAAGVNAPYGEIYPRVLADLVARSGYGE